MPIFYIFLLLCPPLYQLRIVQHYVYIPNGCFLKYSNPESSIYLMSIAQLSAFGFYVTKSSLADDLGYTLRGWL